MCQTRTPITAWFECWARWLWSTAAAPSAQLAEAPQPMSLSPRGVMVCAPLFYSLSSDLIIITFMAFCELLKALGEEIKGCILSGLCGYMSPDELFSPVHAHKWLQFTLHMVVKKDEKKKVKILSNISFSLSPYFYLPVNLYIPLPQQTWISCLLFSVPLWPTQLLLFSSLTCIW